MAGTYRSSKSGVADKVANTAKGVSHSKMQKKSREETNKARVTSAKVRANAQVISSKSKVELEKEKNKGKRITMKTAKIKAEKTSKYNQNRSRAKLSTGSKVKK